MFWSYIVFCDQFSCCKYFSLRLSNIQSYVLRINLSKVFLPPFNFFFFFFFVMRGNCREGFVGGNLSRKVLRPKHSIKRCSQDDRCTPHLSSRQYSIEPKQRQNVPIP